MYTVTRKRKIGTQAGCSFDSLISEGTQCGSGSYSYKRYEKDVKLTYDQLRDRYLWDKDFTFSWLMEDLGLLMKCQSCDVCQEPMKLVKCDDRRDGLKWECRRVRHGKKHRSEKSVRKGSWFEKSNLTFEEAIKFTYWWTKGLTQKQIKEQLGLGPNTAVDWDMFCREMCEISIQKRSEPIGGPGKYVQIDESKIGKRKYHRGHRVEGQWVFGGIEEESRKCFIVAVEDRSEKTLLSIIKQWIKPGTTIISDCWKGYVNLEKHGYIHKTVNHSKEFVNEDGDHTNKIEGHWRQMKASLPTHGRKKDHYGSYIAEFIWRYINRDKDLFWVFLEDMKDDFCPL